MNWDLMMCLLLCVCVCVTFVYGKPNILLGLKRNMQPIHQFIPLFLISSQAKDVSIHIHAALKIRRHDAFTAYI